MATIARVGASTARRASRPRRWRVARRDRDWTGGARASRCATPSSSCPSSSCSAPARRAFAAAGGWMPRVETTRTLAASLGPPPRRGSGELGSTPPLDTLLARSCCRPALGRRVVAPRPRAASAQPSAALVATAHELLGRCAAQPPAGDEPLVGRRASALQPPGGGRARASACSPWSRSSGPRWRRRRAPTACSSFARRPGSRSRPAAPTRWPLRCSRGRARRPSRSTPTSTSTRRSRLAGSRPAGARRLRRLRGRGAGGRGPGARRMLGAARPVALVAQDRRAGAPGPRAARAPRRRARRRDRLEARRRRAPRRGRHGAAATPRATTPAPTRCSTG